MNDTPPGASRRRLFWLWLAAVYGTWLSVVVLGGYWESVRSHWPIAVAMAFGAYVAGSTPMGGGTVGFPVLVLIFDHPGSLGRNFALAVQSVGMVSASIYILSSGTRLDWTLLRPALVGSLIGTPLGAALVAPFVPDLWVKLLFATVWASFGIMHLMKVREMVTAHGANNRWRAWDGPIGLTIGVVGGIVASITGVAIDMMIYTTMVLLYRADLKVSIPTSVVLMAFTSVVGIGSNLLLAQLRPGFYAIDREVFVNFLAAAPVVAVCAPFGALVLSVIPRVYTLVIVSLLCIGQFVWTLVHEQVSGLPLAAAIMGMLAVNAVFHVLYRLGRDEHVFDDRFWSTTSTSEVETILQEIDE